MPISESSDRPLIAIVGSLDPARSNYYPALQDLVHGEQACEELGRALAEAGCDLLVFSSKSTYVEPHVVRGYVAASTPTNPGRVVARPPRHRTVAFDLPGDSVTQIVVQPDTSEEWELAYYRSLLSAYGIILLGGGQSTRIAGIVTLIQQVPILPVAAFGAGQVRVNLDKERNDTTDDDIALMGQPWSTELATPLVASLLAQAERRRQRRAKEARMTSQRAWAGRIALTLAVLALVVSWLATPFAGSATPPDSRALTLLLAIPMVAAMAGSLLRNSQEEERWGWSAARGLAAGFVTVFLYLAGQLVSVPDLLQHLDPQRLLFFLAPLGFVAGFAFDKVLENFLGGQMKVPTLGSGPPSSH